MKNFINDLNKMVSTAQKIDKLLTEKPKKTLPTKSIPLTNEERKFIRGLLKRSQIHGSNIEQTLIETLLNKIK